MNIARADESGVQVVKGGVAVDLEGAVTTDIVDSWGSGTEVTVEALQILYIDEVFVSMQFSSKCSPKLILVFRALGKCLIVLK